MEGMHIIADNEPIAPARTPRACDFTDRLKGLGHDVVAIELAVTTACKHADPDRAEAIIQQLRKLHAEIDELAEMVLPPMTDAEKQILANALKRGRP
jgi:hypothetical protein